MAQLKDLEIPELLHYLVKASFTVLENESVELAASLKEVL